MSNSYDTSGPNVFVMAEFDKQCVYFEVTREITKAIEESTKPLYGQAINRQGLEWAAKSISDALKKFFIPQHIKVEITRDIEDRTKLSIIFLDERPSEALDGLGGTTGICRKQILSS